MVRKDKVSSTESNLMWTIENLSTEKRLTVNENGIVVLQKKLPKSEQFRQEFSLQETIRSTRSKKGGYFFFEYCHDRGKKNSRRRKGGCKNKSKNRRAYVLAITNGGELILVKRKMKALLKPKERVREGKDMVSWRSNSCTPQTCPCLYQHGSCLYSKKSRDSREDSKKRSNRRPPKERTSRRKDKASSTKYFLYFKMKKDFQLVPSDVEVRGAYNNPPRRTRTHHKKT